MADEGKYYLHRYGPPEEFIGPFLSMDLAVQWSWAVFGTGDKTCGVVYETTARKMGMAIPTGTEGYARKVRDV